MKKRHQKSSFAIRAAIVAAAVAAHSTFAETPDFGSYYQFQYNPDFVRSGVQIAPICMPLRDEIYKCNRSAPQYLGNVAKLGMANR